LWKGYAMTPDTMLASMMREIIDCHGHLGRYASQYIPHGGTAESMVTMMDALGFRTLCISGLLALAPDAGEGNRLTLEAAAAHPGRFAVYLVYNPTYPAEDQRKEMERPLERRDAIGVKLHTTLHQTGAGDPKFEPAYELARRAGKMVLCHTWGVADIQGIERMARKYPEVPILMGHSGGYETAAMLEAVRVAQENANAYLDLTLSGMFDGVVEHFARNAGAEKVLFGSDMPFIDPRANLGRVVFARIPDADKRMILGLNMKRLLAAVGYPV
jgi:predicted TIM-barrel fold metal-dependent hydrolase